MGEHKTKTHTLSEGVYAQMGKLYMVYIFGPDGSQPQFIPSLTSHLTTRLHGASRR
jgi:hypothetical protein